MNDQILWYATRGAGAVSLLLLTGVTVLGLLARLRVESPSWPRFLTAQVHGEIAVLSLVFLAIHILTAITDPFTHLGLAALVPFASPYRTFWLGLGAVALYLLLALLITSWLRHAMGPRAWRAAHWTAYAMWPIAVMHGIGTGSDSTQWWMMAVTVACVLSVAIAVIWRLAAAPPDRLAGERRASARNASWDGGS